MSRISKKIKLILDSCVLVFIFYGVNQGVFAKKPEILQAQSWSRIDDGEFLIQEGDELRIECNGDGIPLQFSGPKIIGNIEEREDVISNPSNPDLYTLVRFPATAEDTGWYGCAEEGIKIQNDDQTIDHPVEDISWIYIYVNSSNPFAISDISTSSYLETTARGTVVVPCRPTSPYLNVILYMNFEHVIVGGNLTYDRKIGFIMRYVDGGDNDAGFECKIDGIDLEYTAPSFQLFVSHDIPMSNTDVKTDEWLQGDMGENLTLHCNITVPKGTYVELSWEIPNFFAKDRMISKSDISHNDGKTTRKQSLTIINAEVGDTGIYVCVATYLHDTARSSTSVTIMDPTLFFISHKVEGNSSISAAENYKAIWQLTINGYPPRLIEWYKGENRIEIAESDSSQKYWHSMINTTTDYYGISNLTIDDNGNYTIRITETTTTPKDPIVIPLQLMVIVKPVNVTLNHSLIYEPGRIAVISCDATGSPRPDVTWTFSEWTPEEDVESTSPLNITSEAERRGDFSVLSSIKMPIRSMGNLTCKACNIAGCTDVTAPIFISDGDGFFGIVNRGLQPVTEGDNLTLICAASRFNYTNNIQWVLENSTGPEISDSRISIENDKKTNFTWQSILEIRDVKGSDAGNYSCQAVSIAGDNDTKIYDLVVYGAEEPYFIDTNMNNSDMFMNSAKAYSSKNFECLCQGRPKPVVTWRKNGQPLTKSDTQHTLSNDNYTLFILFFNQSANYSCIARNRLNSVERYVNIIFVENSENTTTWVSLICVLVIIIIIVITYTSIKVHRERVLRKELLEAGLTHFVDGALECLNPDLTLDDQAELLPYDKKWEFPRELLKLGKQLGSGAFGVVMKAEARGIIVEGEVTTVAVKMVRRSADPSYMKALSSELKIMIHLGRHLNVVNLLGACTKTILTKRELYVIVEYCRFGNLHNYLYRNRAIFINQIDPSTHKIDPSIGLELLVMSEDQVTCSPTRTRFGPAPFSRSVSGISSTSNRASNSGTESVHYNNGMDSGNINMFPDGRILSNNLIQPGWRSNYRGDYKYQNLKPICTQDVLCWAWQVSCGMKYLSARNVLHGDLAARNILLADDNIVKICDFGLAKNMYKDNNYKKKGDSPLPIKWMSIESIRDRVFSTQSDVWSFGIVLWEFFTLSQTPYPGIEADKQYEKLLGGYRLEKPEYATEEIYNIMLHCWRAKPSLRPTFTELVDDLGALLNERITMHYFKMNSPYMDMNTLALQNGQHDYLNMMSAPTHDYHNSPDLALTSPSSNYLPMSPIGKTNELEIFSPRIKLDEFQFGFPSSKANISNPLDPGYYVNGGPDKILVDVTQEDKDPSLNSDNKQRILSEGGAGNSKVTNSLNYSNLGGQSFNNPKNSYKNLNEVNREKNNKEQLSSPGIGEDNNYINLPKNKACPPKDRLEGFMNPSYVIMSAKAKDE